jgi:hypothetical protein
MENSNKEKFSQKLGDAVERAGEKVSNMGAVKTGHRISNLGDRIEHSQDVQDNDKLTPDSEK